MSKLINYFFPAATSTAQFEGAKEDLQNAAKGAAGIAVACGSVALDAAEVAAKVGVSLVAAYQGTVVAHGLNAAVAVLGAMAPASLVPVTSAISTGLLSAITYAALHPLAIPVVGLAAGILIARGNIADVGTQLKDIAVDTAILVNDAVTGTAKLAIGSVVAVNEYFSDEEENIETEVNKVDLAEAENAETVATAADKADESTEVAAVTEAIDLLSCSWYNVNVVAPASEALEVLGSTVIEAAAAA